ncbi:T9SS type A sorting domain-containing protein [Spirosoma aerolatum]|uniref:T9SS type A sorting domain-containing protein n=1 Tax=Spirosoma aerolatum TaxID=1211326 RepID=UPI0009AC657A|nr:T9SS type A sorting domain-containing protein [Spirosoma aerolatum]
MRPLLLLILGLCSVQAIAQQIETERQIRVVYPAYSVRDEKALVSIETASKLISGAVVSYRAGRSITLSPGFSTEKGAILSATIQPIATESNAGLRLAIAPNPVGLNAVIDYTIPTSGEVVLAIIDAKGNTISELVKEVKESGTHRHNWDSSLLSTGAYICILRIGNQSLSARVIKQ